jgi:hypothetical protein
MAVADGFDGHLIFNRVKGGITSEWAGSEAILQVELVKKILNVRTLDIESYKRCEDSSGLRRA